MVRSVLVRRETFGAKANHTKIADPLQGVSPPDIKSPKSSLFENKATFGILILSIVLFPPMLGLNRKT